MKETGATLYPPSLKRPLLFTITTFLLYPVRFGAAL